jgi:hypothetical protein
LSIAILSSSRSNVGRRRLEAPIVILRDERAARDGK